MCRPMDAPASPVEDASTTGIGAEPAPVGPGRSWLQVSATTNSVRSTARAHFR